MSYFVSGEVFFSLVLELVAILETYPWGNCFGIEVPGTEKRISSRNPV